MKTKETALHLNSYTAEQAQLIHDYPSLTPVTPQSYATSTLAAKNIKTELKQKFPGVKFTVKSLNSSIETAITIQWTLGPTRAQVEAITDKYTESRFSHCDNTANSNEALWHSVFSGVNTILLKRDLEDAIVLYWS